MASKVAVLAVLRAGRPSCRHAADTLAFTLHAAALTEGYNLVAVGADADAVAAGAVDANADPSRGWNAWDDAYAFRSGAYIRKQFTGNQLVRECICT